VDLSRTRSVEDVAALIWTGRFDAWPAPSVTRKTEKLPSRSLPFLARAQAMLAVEATHDPFAFDMRAEAVARCGARIVELMTRAAGGSAAREPIEARLSAGWRLRRGAADVLRATIILCADHELNVSAFTARCVASAGANPYGVVIAGLAALEGVRHGGMTARVESMLDSMRRERGGREALGARLREGTRVEGFGHPLYPEGDPRAIALLGMLETRFPRSPELRFAREVAGAAWATLEQRPSVDFALATVSRVLELPPRSGLTLFALGRTIGWIGHAIEQYRAGTLIRPRAKYVGPLPAANR
jgi:citrate synthase